MHIPKKQIAGIVTIYYPTDPLNVIGNIYSISDKMKLVIIIDNSDNDNFKKNIPDSLECNFIYLPMYKNTGVAKALNVGIKEALKWKINYVLLMDQDSNFAPKEIEIFYKDFLAIKLKHKNFLLCPTYPTENKYTPRFFTSGSILTLNVINEIGWFDEKLFIDEVDGEFNRRLSAKKIPMLKSKAFLTHQLGNKIIKHFFGMNLSSDNHNEIRKYYIARNRTYLVVKDINLFWIYFKDSLIKLILMLLIEEDLWLKLKYITKGIIDGVTGKMGKIR